MAFESSCAPKFLQRNAYYVRIVLEELTKNQFKFEEIRGYLNEFNLFCD